MFDTTSTCRAMAPLLALSLVACGGAAREAQEPQANAPVIAADTFDLPRSLAGPAVQGSHDPPCGFRGRDVSTTAFTRYPLPEVRGRGDLRYRRLTSGRIVRVDDGFGEVMRRQLWLRGCLERAEVDSLALEFHVAGDGRVRRIDVDRAEPPSLGLERCLRLATLLEFESLGCSWHRRWPSDWP